MAGLTWTKGRRPQDAEPPSLNGMTGVVPASGSSRRDYEPTAAWDEAFMPEGRPRRHYAELVNALQSTDLEELASSVAQALADAGVVFGDGEQSAPFRVDPVPRVLPPAEWELLSRGLSQRARALGAFVADAYGDRAIVAAGRMPVRAIESAESFEPWMMGVPLNAVGFVIGFDLVRDSDGAFGVLEDNCRTPSGVAYMTGARAALDRHLPLSPPTNRLDPGAAFEILAEALRACAPDGSGDPSIALLSDGPGNSAWYEHRAIARRLGVPIVSPDDLLVRRGCLHARLESGGTQEVQVVYRRTDEDQLRHPDGRATWLADALLGPCRNEKLSVVNPLGAGLSDDKLVHAYVDEMVRFYLDEEPLVPSVCTYDLGDREVLEDVIPRLDELVVKPRTGHGGAGVVVCPHASEEDRREIEKQVRANPTAWIAQEMVMLSTHPTVCGGRLEPRHVDLRPFVVGAGGSAETVPGGLTRVAFGAGALVVNSSQNGGGKDTWALA